MVVTPPSHVRPFHSQEQFAPIVSLGSPKRIEVAALPFQKLMSSPKRRA